MYTDIDKKLIVDQLDILLNQLVADLEKYNEIENQNLNQFSNREQEKQIFHENDYFDEQNQNGGSSIIGGVEWQIGQLKEFQNQFKKVKDILLVIPNERKQIGQYIKEQRSKIKSSFINSYIINNSEIEKQKLEQIQGTLNDFIKNPSQFNQLICPKHNQRIQQVDISKDPSIDQRILCKNCVKQGVSFQEFLQLYLGNFFQIKIKIEQNRYELKKKIIDLSSLIQTQKNVNEMFINFNQMFQTRIDMIDKLCQSKNNLNNQLEFMAKDYALNQQNLQSYNQSFQKNLQEKAKLDFDNAKIEMDTILQNLRLGNYKSPNVNVKENFCCILKNTELQSEICQALCFNRNDTILATALSNTILIWQFERNSMQFKTELKFHNKDVSCIIFEKQSDTIISSGGDGDGLIVIWNYEKEYTWRSIQHQENDGGIKSMILNQKEDQLFTGTQRGKIIIWSYIQRKLQKVQEIIVNDQERTPIFGLSCNDKTQQLISCGKDKILRLYQLDQKFKCTIFKQCDSQGMRIKFIDDQSFVLVQQNGWFIHFRIEWECFKEQQKIRLSQDIHDYIYTPIWYNSKSQLLMVKHFRKIYFLKKQNNGLFEVIHSQDLLCDLLFATIQNKGNHLVTWIKKGKDQANNYDLQEVYQVFELNYQ